MSDRPRTLIEIARAIVKETSGNPSIILGDSQPYQPVPTSLCDALQAAVEAEEEMNCESRSTDEDVPGISSARRDYVPLTGNDAEPRLAMVSERHLKQKAGLEPADSLTTSADALRVRPAPFPDMREAIQRPLTTDNPDVIACMGSVAECAANGCQFRKTNGYRVGQKADFQSAGVTPPPPPQEKP